MSEITITEKVAVVYTFRHIQVHKKLPHMSAWYWYITSMADMLLLGEMVTQGRAASATIEVMGRLHNNQERALAGKNPTDGHFNNSLSYLVEAQFKENEMVTLERVASIATDITFNTKLRVFIEQGNLYVGANLIGFCFDMGQHIIEEVTVDKFAFPVIDDEPEIITIGKWPNGRHYYLKSNKQRVFPQEKYNTLKSAKKEALKHTDEEHIEDAPKMPFTYGRVGD